jgi:hypothetical protein
VRYFYFRRKHLVCVCWCVIEVVRLQPEAAVSDMVLRVEASRGGASLQVALVYVIVDRIHVVRLIFICWDCRAVW